VAVVDAGCGCRPRRATTRLLSQLPSFLRPSAAGKPSAPVGRSSSRSSSGFFPSSASTASSATFATTQSSYSNYSPSLLYDHSYKPPEQAPAGTKKVATAGSTASGGKQRDGKKRRGADESGVGVAVEKESSDPRADFRESMLQMVVEMGLCGWDDLRCMLRRLLALNAPRHHAAILAAFAEVCAQLTAPQPEYQYQAYDDYHYHY
jgi:uncharacterized protein (TIGR01568 family)